LKYSILKCRFSVPVARQPALPWQPFFAPLVGVFLMLASKYELIRPPSTELLQFLTGYVTLRCDLHLWPFDLGVMSRDATWVVNPCTKFKHDTTYRSRVRTTTIFHWPPA